MLWRLEESPLRVDSSPTFLERGQLVPLRDPLGLAASSARTRELEVYEEEMVLDPTGAEAGIREWEISPYINLVIEMDLDLRALEPERSLSIYTNPGATRGAPGDEGILNIGVGALRFYHKGWRKHHHQTPAPEGESSCLKKYLQLHVRYELHDEPWGGAYFHRVIYDDIPSGPRVVMPSIGDRPARKTPGNMVRFDPERHPVTVKNLRIWIPEEPLPPYRC